MSTVKEICNQKSVYGFRSDIAMLRLMAIVIVVAFHAYGMCYVESHIPQPTTEVYRNLYEHFNQCVLINIAMPLFIFVAGFLFDIKLRKGMYGSLWQVAKNKAKRLILPYYVFMVLMMLTYSGFSLAPFYTGSYWHLWFLFGIWWPFIATWLLRNLLFSSKPWVKILILLIAYSVNLFGNFIPNLFGLTYLSTILCFFILGALVSRYEFYFKNAIRKNKVLLLLVTIYLITIFLFPTEYGKQDISKLVSSTCAVIAIWYIFQEIPWRHLRVTPWLVRLSTLSFGIYIFHNWVEVYLVSTTAKRLFPIVEFAENHIYLFPLLFTLTAFIISAVLTRLLLSTKVGRMLIG